MLGQAKSKFGMDVIWNLGSFVLAGVVFMLVNFVLLLVYGEEAVGVFTQVYAWYIVLSQLAVSGVHLSVQVFIPKHKDDTESTHSILGGALLVTLIFSLVVTGLAYLFHEWPGKIMESQGLTISFRYVIWGLVFFSLNKVLLAYHNGFRRMKLFATFNFIRVAGMLGTLAVFVWVVDRPDLVPSLLAWAELFLFVILFGYTLKYFRFRAMERLGFWFKEHFHYGIKALLGNFLLDLNTRVDVIMLGFFLNDKMVGIYGFSLAIAEGVMQIPVIFRNNINPVITRAQHSKLGPALLNRLLKRNVKSFYKVIGGLGLFTIVVFPAGLWLMSIEEHFYAYWIVFAILVGSLVLSAGYLPFQMIFNQLGKPWLQTNYVFLIFVVNVAGNAALIPWLGITGAAVGTALSIASQVIFLKVMLKAKTPYRI